MNIKEYIESGILEAYVLNALSATERAEVAALIARYPELQAEVDEIEVAMQHFVEEAAEEPPAYMQQQIWNALKDNATAPAITSTEHKVIPLTTPERSYNTNWQWAAVLLALAGSLLTNIMLWYQKNNTEEQAVAMHHRVDTLQQQQQQLAVQLDNYRKEKDMMADSTVQTIVMKSMRPGHPMVATVYWSKMNGDTYLSMQKLPVPPKGMQYQMWVIKAGKPVSMGMLANNMVEKSAVTRLPMQVSDGQAFAISLEKEGGNPTPTTVYVLGKVS